MTENAQQRAQRDADELVSSLCRLQNEGLLHSGFDAYRTAAENLVTWGWTYLAPGEQVTRQPTPRNTELDLRDELAATIAGVVAAGGERPLALADYLVRDGWVKLGPGEKVVQELTEAEATRIVARALLRWEEHKDAAKKQGKGPNWAREAARKYAEDPAEVSSDESELTSGVKGPSAELLILAAFAGADRPLEYTEACDAAAGTPVQFFPDRPWHRWNAAFRSLEDRGLVEALPAAEGEIKRFVLTEAGRSLYVQDGVGGDAG